MYLKRLEVFGFKSFAEKTELDFGPGITAVVGPNGSGKSNVADAIKWVLGEQSAKALRGGNMSDVIFAGSDGKKAMGFAQVSMVLDNADGKLGVGFHEVMVTRRVDRSGEGEYFINQVPCRLKDVHDLFLDTGVGKENYSIIGQGKIDEILSSKPEDRRVLFEEAAGISRYKSRKREAQRRLEETEQNLLRITDIISELSSQMDSLAEQAQKAEIYQGLQTELAHLDVGLMAHALDAAAQRLAKQQAENHSLMDRLAEIETRLQAAEQASEVARNLAEALDQEIAVVSLQLNDATGRLERSEGRQALALQEQKNAMSDQQRLELELAALEGKLVSAAGEITLLSEQMTTLQAALLAAAADLTARETALTAAQSEVVTASRAVEERKNRIVAILQLEAEKRNAAASADRLAEDAARRLARLAGERERAEAEASSTRTAADGVAALQAGLSAERDGLAGRVASLRTAHRTKEQLLQELQQKSAAIREQIQGSSARLGAIEEMMNAFEGYQKGARTVLQGREKGLPWAAEVLGSVAELIRTEPRYERAIEIALGGNIQNLVTQTDEGAKQAIEHLKRTAGGRATFLPLNVIRPNSYRADEEREFHGAPGILGVALDLVRFEERFRPAIASLLGRTLIATDMNAAVALGRKAGMRYRIVTLDGELLAPGGALTGGSTGTQGSGLLSRERERDELQAAIVTLRADLTAIRKSFDETQQARTDLEKQIQATEQDLRAVETRIIQSEGEATRVAGEARRWAEVLQTFGIEAESIQGDAQEGADSARTLRTELEGLAAERTGLEAEVAQLSAEGQTRVAALEEQGRELTAVQVRLAELNQQAKGLAAQTARLESDRAAIVAEQTIRHNQMTEVAMRLDLAAAELVAAEAEVTAAGADKRTTLEHQAQLKSRKLEALEQTNAREREMRNLRRSQSESQARLQQGEVEEARLQMEVQSTSERLLEQYGMTPAEVAGKALPDDEIPGARERTLVLREQIRELGPVNVAAIEEFRTAQERYDFLGHQRDDLDEAKNSLYRAIEELDKRIKSHFLDSFQVIRREFQRVYTELFEGGKADLELVDENDLLETGIEIIAQPPGKKPQTLSLLSGGERAMTAIALLFALLRVKPTPFVILDEVEAALDEANVERFGKYLRMFSTQGSQFVCITHQRGTMEVADALYGVTMEGTGVSKVVSVRLVDVEREAS